MATSTSVTRSRRAEGLRHPHSSNTVTYRSHSSPQNHNQHPLANAKSEQSPSPIKQNAATTTTHQRNKRSLEPAAARECDPVAPKKARYEFAVEIPARPSFRQSTSIESRDAKPPTPAPNPKPVVTVTAAPKPPNPSRAPPTTAAKPSTTSTKQPSGLTRHQEKVVNGLKHELSRLNPNAADTIKEGGRKLRSQEGTRFKSELAAYFPDYDEVIGNDPKEQRKSQHHPPPFFPTLGDLVLDTPVISIARRAITNANWFSNRSPEPRHPNRYLQHQSPCDD